MKAFTNPMARVTPTPIATPARASQAKVPKALVREKAPVVAASTAIRMKVRPLASFSRDSPSRMCISRLGMGARPAMA